MDLRVVVRVGFGLGFWIWYFGMAWDGLGIFGMDGKGHRYCTRHGFFLSYVAGATSLFSSSFSSSWTA
jgi:hypothetical protein